SRKPPSDHNFRPSLPAFSPDLLRQTTANEDLNPVASQYKSPPPNFRYPRFLRLTHNPDHQEGSAKSATSLPVTADGPAPVGVPQHPSPTAPAASSAYPVPYSPTYSASCSSPQADPPTPLISSSPASSLHFQSHVPPSSSPA
ncbi:hypothetical protein PTTG_11130, partial [Puccinia triticina 1-1 BBBD Race 1]|uniref:Uncharacterized protein n=1 Tax=Puccinia triticina (isolate 1-1 / race 1 (BBBD)) TaxID=630390 RepID=A0A0C4FD26_PUCT1